MNILVVDDEKKIATFIRKGLQERGFSVTVSHNGDDAYLLACSESFDLIVLDIMLPGRDGLSIVKNLREKKITIPIILLTARSETNEKIEGLNLGADDYVTKPFFVEELIARVNALVRRSSGEQLSVLRNGKIEMNLITREVSKDGEKIELTPREFSLLEYLLRSPGRVFTRTQILEHVWGYNYDPQTNIVEVCIKRIRSKIEDNPATPLIETVRGVGYRSCKLT